MAFYAPAVIALLLQHLAVSFGALSIVPEKRMGRMELFKAAPLTAFELLLGKFLSYLVFCGLIGAVLTAAVVYLLDVPMLGQWQDYGLVLIALISASTGVGFIVSLLAKEISQAVQFTMILLLASVFFTGFFQDLDLFWEPIRALGMALPATYGIRLLQNVMLRGQLFPGTWLYVLSGMAIGLVVVGWLLLRGRMVPD